MLHREAVEAFLVLVLACLSASTIRRLLIGLPSDSGHTSAESRSGSSYALYFYTGLGLLIGFGFVVIPVSSAITRLYVTLGLPFLMVVGLDEVTTKVLIVVALLVMVLRGERRSLRSIGIVKPHLSDIAWGFVFFAIGEMGIDLMVTLLPQSFSVSAENGDAMLARFPLSLMLMVALVNGIFEEITARGFAVERLGEITHSTVAGGAIALAINVAAHIPYWGWRASIILTPGLVAFFVLYLWRRSVVPCAIGHVLNDAYPALFVAIVPLLPMSVTQHFSYDRQGTICYKKVEFDRSIVFYSRAIERNPRDAYAYRWRGLSYIKKKDYPKAFADLAQAMRIDPTDGRPYRHRAFAYETQKDYPHALIDLRQAIALNPDDAASYEMRARIEGATQDWQAAAKDYTRAIHLDPTDAERYDKCAAAEDKIGAEGVAILYYRIATRFDRQDTLAWTRLATAYASDFRDQEALSALDHVFALEPDSKYGYAARSSIEQHREKYDLALADINKAIALDSAEPDWFVQRALILVAQKNYSSAIADYGHAIALKSDDPSLYERRADLYLRIQDYSGAMADWSKALQLEDGHGTTHSLIAWILATNADPKVRDGKRAIELATKSCELSGWKDGNPIDTLAAAYAEAGDFQHAIEFENRAIALMQDDEDWIEDARSRLKLYEEHQAYRDSSG